MSIVYVKAISMRTKPTVVEGIRPCCCLLRRYFVCCSWFTGDCQFILLNSFSHDLSFLSSFSKESLLVVFSNSRRQNRPHRNPKEYQRAAKMGTHVAINTQEDYALCERNQREMEKRTASQPDGLLWPLCR